MIAVLRLLSPGQLLLIGGMLLVIRRPESLLRAEFFAESLPVFYLPTYFSSPTELVTTPFAGYLHLVPRLIAYIERAVPTTYAPLVGACVAIAITLSIAWFIASDRLAPALPTRWIRQCLAGALLLSPSVSEVLAVDVNVQVFLSVYLVALALSRPAMSATGRRLDVAGATLAGLSGPYALLFAPLFWPRRDRVAAVVTACGLIQLAVIVIAPQRTLGVPALPDLLDIAALRVNAAVLGATLGTIAPAATAIVLAAGILFVAFRVAPKRAWVSFAYASLIVAAGGIVATGALLAIDARAGERYFLLPGMTVAVVVALGVESTDHLTRIAARVLGAMLVIGIAVNFRVSPFPDTNWNDQARCIGSASPCIIRVYPPRFDTTWPGNDAQYRPPTLWPQH